MTSSVLFRPLFDLKSSARPATVDAGVALAYSCFYSDVQKLVVSFNNSGLIAGDRVALLAYNCRELMVAHFALAHLHAIGVNLNTELAPTELAYMMDDTSPKILIAHHTFESQVRKILKAMRQRERVGVQCILWISGPDNSIGPSIESYIASNSSDTDGRAEYPFLKVMLQSTTLESQVHVGADQQLDASRDHGFSIFYTSGTTGKPKGVLLSQGNVYEHAAGCVDAYELSCSDTWLHLAPFFHVLDVWAVFGMTMVGGVHVLMNKFRPEVAIQLLESLDITVTIFTPAMARLLMKNATPAHKFKLRMVSMGGAGVDEQLMRDITTTFNCDAFVSYGMTECSGRICVSTVSPQLATAHRLSAEDVFLLKCTCGHQFHHTEIEVRDKYGILVARDGNQVGLSSAFILPDIPASAATRVGVHLWEVWVRGDTVFKEYWGRPEDTRKAFVNGWLATGDLATQNEHGFIQIASRKKDMIIVGGENVYPADVELVLKQMEGVSEVAVFGVADPMLGEIVKAAIVPDHLWEGRLTQADVMMFASTRLARFKGPHSVIFCKGEDIPRTATGKVKKEALKKKDQEQLLNLTRDEDPLLAPRANPRPAADAGAAGSGEGGEEAAKNCLPGLRFVCIVEVLVNHFGRRHQALAWKDARMISSSMQLMFLVSGYMIASAYGSRGASWRKVVDFYVARLSAFYPLYMMAVLLSLPVFCFWADVFELGGMGQLACILSNLFAVQVWYSPFVMEYNTPLWFGAVYIYCILLVPYVVGVVRRSGPEWQTWPALGLWVTCAGFIPNLLLHLLDTDVSPHDDTYDWGAFFPDVDVYYLSPCMLSQGSEKWLVKSMSYVRDVWIFMTGVYVFMVHQKTGTDEVNNHLWRYLTDAISSAYFILWFWEPPSGKENLGIDSWSIFGYLQLSALPALFYFYCLVVAHPDSLTVSLLASPIMQLLGSLTLFIYLLHWQVAQYYLVVKYGNWELTSTVPI
ncbi:hypothetical protein CYMTET_23536, partial [Cymbomonas tetramitiformis]